MSEEEKKALEVLNNKVEYINNMPINTRDERTIRFAIEVQKVANEIIDIANEIIIRQQKEIEDLKKQNKQLCDYLNDSYYVSADKIKERIIYIIENYLRDREISDIKNYYNIR